MKNKIFILSLALIITFFILNSQIIKANSQGIILADNQKIIDIFRDKNKNKVDNLITDLKNYNDIIIHLGAKKVFERGNAFFYKNSQENLNYFINKLKKDDKNVYLWFLDSFGENSFLEIYNEHQEIITANYNHLKKMNLNYDGIVIDLEWINFGTKDNSKKFLKILSYLNTKFSNKEIYVFASLLDNSLENKNRGYYEKEMLKHLDNIIVMLYFKDGGYYLKNQQVKFIFKSERIKELRNYYNKENYKIAVSIVGGIILERNNNLYFIKNTNEFNYKNQTEKIYENINEYHTVKGYKVKESFTLTRNDGLREEIKAGEKLHFLKIDQENLLEKDNYIWEFFYLNEK